jgi:hypothetical protein
MVQEGERDCVIVMTEDGVITKQSFSIMTQKDQHLHLRSYFSYSHAIARSFDCGYYYVLLAIPWEEHN